MKRESITSHDGQSISICVWDEVSEPKMILQIAHGMAEHIERYDAFAQFLNANGIIVAGDDHRAHGQTCGGVLGHCDGDIFYDTVGDLLLLTKKLKLRYSLPVILLGHSYGSFLAQSYLMRDCEGLIEGVILMGSANMKGLMLSFGHFLAKGKVKKGKGGENGEIFAKLTFKSYDKKFNEGKNAWLSRDKNIVDKYNLDKFCGYICSNAFYESFFRGLKKIIRDNHSICDKSIKMLIVSGASDCVGNNGKLVTRLYNRYKRLGFSPKLKLYENARHEILNETNHESVYNDILEFINIAAIYSD